MKKIILLVLVGVLGVSTGTARPYDSAINRKVKGAFDASQKYPNKRVEEAFRNAALMKGVMEDEDQAGSEVRSYLQHLMYAADSIEDINWDESTPDIHAILMKADSDDESVAFYQYLVNTFTKTYKESPLQGSLDQYQDFYKMMTADEEHEKSLVLSTIGIWSTNNLCATAPFLEGKSTYWYTTPTDALNAYNTMGLIDHQEALKIVLESMTSQHGGFSAADGGIKDVKKEFFAVWKDQDDRNLPCVQDAEKLQNAAINAAE